MNHSKGDKGPYVISGLSTSGVVKLSTLAKEEMQWCYKTINLRWRGNAKIDKWLSFEEVLHSIHSRVATQTKYDKMEKTK